MGHASSLIPIKNNEVFALDPRSTNIKKLPHLSLKKRRFQPKCWHARWRSQVQKWNSDALPHKTQNNNKGLLIIPRNMKYFRAIPTRLFSSAFLRPNSACFRVEAWHMPKVIETDQQVAPIIPKLESESQALPRIRRLPFQGAFRGLYSRQTGGAG